MQIITFAAFKLHSLSDEFIRQLLHYIQHYHVQHAYNMKMNLATCQ